MIPATWMPAAKMQRIHAHWTAGGHKASEFDRKHYHFLVEADGKLVRGIPSVKLNEAPPKAGYAAHTLSANSGAIAISLCCMGGTGVREQPFVPGPYPMTQAQWDAMIVAIADLATRYGIPVTPRTILSHAEVEPTLGIKQRGKWDFTRLAFDRSVIGHKACGDRMRREVAALLDGRASPPGWSATSDFSDSAKPAVYVVTGVKPSTLTFRDGPNGNRIGAVPEGTRLEKLGAEDGMWWQVRSPAGYVGWVWSDYLAAA